MKNQTPTFSQSYEVGMRAIGNDIPKLMKRFEKRRKIRNILFVLMWTVAFCLILFGCTPEEQNCDAKLQELEALQEQGFKNCNGSTTCIYKMSADYNRKKQEILNNCH